MLTRTSQLTFPRVNARSSSTPWYSGVRGRIQRTTSGYVSAGTKVAEKRNIGNVQSSTKAKSAQERISVVPNTDGAANAAETRSALGIASRAQGDSSRPMASITVTNPIEYTVPRIRVYVSSPSATSRTVIGVARTPSYVFAYFSLKNTLPDSYTAPFIADAARRAGATNSR